MSVRLVASSALSFSPWLLDFYLGIEVYKSADSIHSFRHSAYIRCGFITMIDHFPHFVRPFHTTYLPFFTSVKPYIAKTFRLEWQKTSRTVVWHSGFHQNFVLGGGGGLEKFLVPKFSIIFPFMRNINIRWVKKKGSGLSSNETLDWLVPFSVSMSQKKGLFQDYRSRRLVK